MSDFTQGKYDKVIIIYNQFKNAATQIVMKENYLPVQTLDDENASIGDNTILYA